MTRSRWGRCLAAAMVTVGRSVAAQTAPGEGTVVRVDGDLLVVDLGRDSGLTAGQRVPLLRPITVRHPITGQSLRDRFPLGSVLVYSVGDALTVLRHSEGLLRPPAVGDRVVSPLAPPPPLRPPPPPPRPARPVAVATPAAATTPAATPPAATPPITIAPCATDDVAAPGVGAEERSLMAAFLSTLGRPPAERILRWGVYLRQHPNAPWNDRVRAEIDALAAPSPQAPQQQPPPPQPQPYPLTRGSVADTLRLGDSARVALQVTGVPVLGGRVSARRPGAERYTTQRLAREGDDFWRAEVPASLVTLEGFEYFVEVDVEGGGAVPILGSASQPLRVAVERGPGDAPDPRGRTRIDLRADYADVGSRTIGSRFVAQRFVLVEGDFLQRLQTRALYGYRVGFGVFNGEGLPLSQLAGDAVAQPSMVAYGYHELEFSPSDFVHLIARGQVGVHRGGLVGGAQARIRIGYERRTNLVLGGDVLTEVGQKAFFALNFHPLPRLPMLAQGEVFNQSVASGDPMFRVVAQIGWRATDWFTVSARGSYQLRNIENGGFGAGLSTTFDW